MATQAAWKPWDDRYANQALAIRNWQLAFGAMALFAFTCLGGALWMAGRVKYVVDVTAVDRQGYAVTQLQPLSPQNSPDVVARIQGYEVAKYIREARSVSSDMTVDHTAAEDLYAHTRGAASNFLNDYFLADDKAKDPLVVAQKNTVSVQVESILPLSAKTWQVRWSETRYDLHGNVDEAPTHWTAQLQTELVTPKTSGAIVTNPLGWFVTALAWTQEAGN